MKDEITIELLASTLTALIRQLIELHCRHEVTKVMLVGLWAQMPGTDAEKIAAAMEVMARKKVEETLLRLGDIQPSAADLLGVAEFLKKL